MAHFAGTVAHFYRNNQDVDKVKKQIMELPAEVAKNEAYQNAIKNSNSDTARIESDAALRKVILASMSSGLELFKQFQDNKSFQTWLQDYVFDATYKTGINNTL